MLQEDDIGRMCDIILRAIVGLTSGTGHDRGKKELWFPTKNEIIEAVKGIIREDQEAQKMLERANWQLDGLAVGLFARAHQKPNQPPINLWDLVWAQLELSERASSKTTRARVAALQKELKLEHIEVAASADQVSAVAARLFVKHVRDNHRVTVSCGSTLERMAREVERLKNDYSNLTVFSGVVCCSDAALGTLPSTVANLFARCGKVRTRSFHLPGAILDVVRGVDKLGRRRELFRHLRDCLFKQARDADFIFLGIGVLDDDAAMAGAGFREPDASHAAGAGTHVGTGGSAFSTHVHELGATAAMNNERVAGEVFHWPFNRDGNFLYEHLRLISAHPQCQEAWDRLDAKLRTFFERTYTMAWPDLQRSARIERASTNDRPRTVTIAVAGGEAKHEAIWIALKKLTPPVIDYLVTDADTVDYLYEREFP